VLTGPCGADGYGDGMAGTATTLRSVRAVRYVLALREGGSLPGIVEADDLGTYVLKFRGAGQGLLALVAEVVTGELARRLDLPVPELVLAELDSGLASAEPDEEVQDLIRASHGLNLGMDFLPGSLGIERPDGVDPVLAAQVVWFDALVLNVDRSWRNPNLLRWHGSPYLIDHGAALYFHHDWSSAATVPTRAYPAPRDHVLMPVAAPIDAAHAALAPRITAELLDEVLALVPDEWLAAEDAIDVAARRAAYRDLLLDRAEQAGAWLPALEVARASYL
jgi:hypothetical protein